MDGFGACFIAYDLFPEYQNPEFYDRVVFDLGLSILRVPMGGWENDGNDNDDPSVISWDSFDRSELAVTMEIAQQFQLRGIAQTISTPWSPPSWMKTNRAVVFGGRLRPDNRYEFAEYLEAFVVGAHKYFDVRIDAVSLQNELLFVEPYNSCVYNPLQLRETLRAVQEHFTSAGLDTQLVVPEEMGIPDRLALYLEPLMADGQTRSFKGFFASHGGNGQNNWRQISARLAPFRRKLWMTETSGHTPDWKGGLLLAENIHDTLVGGNASAYIYWQFSEPNPGRMALLAAGDYIPKGYAAKHFTRFIRPGAERIGVGGAPEGLLISAFKHPSTDDITIVIVNPGVNAMELDLQIADPRPPLGWLTYTSQEGSYFQSAVSPRGPITVPARAIVTLHGRCGEMLAELPSLVPAGWTTPQLGPALAKHGTGAVDQRLHAAARANDVNRVRQLLEEQGVDPNALNVGRLSPLHRAAWPGNVDVIRLLIDGGANPNVRDGTGGSALAIAASNGHDAFVEAVAAVGADVNLADRQGIAPLHRAAMAGHVSTVQTLLRLGARAELADSHGWTAMHWAAASPERSAPGVMRVLLQSGAEHSPLDRDGMSPLHVATANLVDPGLFDRPGQSEALRYINADRLRSLVEAGADVNLRDAAGRTPLHWAAWVGETMHGEDIARRAYFVYAAEAIRYLLAAGADPKLPDSTGREAADYADSEGYRESAALLRSVAKRPWLVGDIPATAASDEPAMEKPAQTGPNLGARLLRAVIGGQLAEVRDLLKAGANPDYANPQGSALHAAVISGNLPIVQALLTAGADPGRRDSDGYTALDRAIQTGQEEIAQAIRKEGR